MRHKTLDMADFNTIFLKQVTYAQGTSLERYKRFNSEHEVSFPSPPGTQDPFLEATTVTVITFLPILLETDPASAVYYSFSP